MTERLVTDARTTSGNQRHAKNSYCDYKQRKKCPGRKQKFEEYK